MPLSSGRDCSITRTSSLSQVPMALPRSPSTVPRCATPSAPYREEMLQALADARYDDASAPSSSPASGEKAFCPAGDPEDHGDYGGYKDDEGTHHLNVLDFQREIRTCPKPGCHGGWLRRRWRPRAAMM